MSQRGHHDFGHIMSRIAKKCWETLTYTIYMRS